MPQLIFTGVKHEEVKDISTQLIDTLAKIADAPRDYFTLEVNNNDFVFDGEIIKINPVIRVLWFDRGQTVKDEMARVIDQALRSKGYPNIEIIFEALEKESYYENAEHF
jgi:hypothetical protein